MEATTQSFDNISTFDLASWNRPRSQEELVDFVSAHEDALDVADFDL